MQPHTYGVMQERTNMRPIDRHLKVILETRVRLAHQRHAERLLSESLSNRNMQALLVEGMTSRQYEELIKSIEFTESAIEKYVDILSDMTNEPAGILDYFEELLDRIIKLRNDAPSYEKEKSDAKISKFWEEVSDTAVNVIGMAKSVNDSVNKLVVALEKVPAFTDPANDDKTIREIIESDDVPERMRPRIIRGVTRSFRPPQEGKGLLAKIVQFFKGPKLTADTFSEGILELTLKDLETLSGALTQAEGSVDKAAEEVTDAAQEQQEIEQAVQEGEPVAAADEQATEEELEAAEPEGPAEGDFYRYTTRNGREGIYRVEAALENGNVRIRQVVFEDDKIKTKGSAFATGADKLGAKLTDEEVQESFDTPVEQIRSIVSASESPEEAVESLEDLPVDDLVSAAKGMDPRVTIPRDRGIEMFSGMTQSPGEAAFIYSTVRKAINKEVGYELFEHKRPVDSMDRWLHLAGIKEDK